MKQLNSFARRLVSAMLVTLFVGVVSASAQTAAFTYQGRLTDGANSTPTATYDIKFDLYDADVDGSLIATVTNSAVFVNSGTFTTSLNFGAAAFDGGTRYLQISIRPAGSGVERTILDPRQRITSTPYATQSNKATTAQNFSGNLVGDITGTQTTTVVSNVGGETAANVASGAQIANAATSANSANTVVRRDANGNFAASTVNAANVVLATGGKVTFADGTQQATSVDPSLYVSRNVQSGSIFVEDNRLSIAKTTTFGDPESLLVTSQSFDGITLGGNIARFRSNVGSSSTIMTDRFKFQQSGSFVALSELGYGIIPAVGAGNRMMWHSFKSAFRAGSVDGTQWDEADIGFFSFAGGKNTIAKGNYSVAFGFGNNAQAPGSTLLGEDNTNFNVPNAVATNSFAVGENNNVCGYTGMAIGYGNNAGCTGDLIPGTNPTRMANNMSVAIGYRNVASGNYSAAMGKYASTNGRNGSFVWSDASNANTDTAASNLFTATSDNQFSVKASGGVRFYTKSDLSTGVTLSANGGAWTTVSDRNAKENFGAVNSRDILRGVLNLPISTWSYKGQTYRHIGAMAQDFYQTFNVGENDTTITTVDPDGVAFAAIQGLNEELKDRDVRIEAQQQQLTTLSDKVKQQQLVIDALRALVCKSNSEAEICQGETK